MSLVHTHLNIIDQVDNNWLQSGYFLKQFYSHISLFFSFCVAFWLARSFVQWLCDEALVCKYCDGWLCDGWLCVAVWGRKTKIYLFKLKIETLCNILLYPKLIKNDTWSNFKKLKKIWAWIVQSLSPAKKDCIILDFFLLSSI